MEMKEQRDSKPNGIQNTLEQSQKGKKEKTEVIRESIRKLKKTDRQTDRLINREECLQFSFGQFSCCF